MEAEEQPAWSAEAVKQQFQTWGAAIVGLSHAGRGWPTGARHSSCGAVVGDLVPTHARATEQLLGPAPQNPPSYFTTRVTLRAF